MTLRISQVDGAVTLTLPRGVSEREAMAFAVEKQDWVRSHLAKQGGRVLVGPGMTLSVAGTEMHVTQALGSRLRVNGSEISIPAPADVGRRHLQAWLKEQARAELSRASDHYAQKLGRRYTRITMRDTRSRWGSCSSQGALMYSWRLVLAPRDVMHYVAAHEVAHLKEMNHSSAFWQTVEALYGPYDVARRWLRHDGPSLHRFRFEA